MAGDLRAGCGDAGLTNRCPLRHCAAHCRHPCGHLWQDRGRQIQRAGSTAAPDAHQPRKDHH